LGAAIQKAVPAGTPVLVADGPFSIGAFEGKAVYAQIRVPGGDPFGM